MENTVHFCKYDIATYLLTWHNTDTDMIDIVEELSNMEIASEMPMTNEVIPDTVCAQVPINKNDVKIALPLICASSVNIALLSLPWSNPQFRQTNGPFIIIALKCCLQVPIHCKAKVCQWKKGCQGNWGVHYFQCIHNSKTWLHNRVRDTFFKCLHTVGIICGLITTPSDVSLWSQKVHPRHMHGSDYLMR
eukprot:10201162-Ditylum_brightwellii.AAC.1